MDELVSRPGGAALLVPSKQRLESHWPGAVRREDRLEKDPQLVSAMHGVAQIIFDPGAELDLLVHAMIEESRAIPAVGFCAIQGNVSLAQQILATAACLGGKGDADADADVQSVSLEGARFGGGGLNSFTYGADVHLSLEDHGD